MLVVLPVLLATGCRSPIGLEQEARGKLLFSIRETRDANDIVPKGINGVYFYIEDQELGDFRLRTITGYRVENGDVVDIIGGGSELSDELRRKVEQVAFVPFDFEAEVRRVDALNAARAARDGHGETVTTPFFGGWECEIRFVYGSVDYTLKRRNPLGEINNYAPDSPNIAKLKALVDCFATYYGEVKMD